MRSTCPPRMICFSTCSFILWYTASLAVSVSLEPADPLIVADAPLWLKAWLMIFWFLGNEIQMKLRCQLRSWFKIMFSITSDLCDLWASLISLPDFQLHLFTYSRRSDPDEVELICWYIDQMLDLNYFQGFFTLAYSCNSSHAHDQQC